MNSSFENAEKGLKRWLKREAKITMATVVAFLITGAVSYGAEIVIGEFKTQPGKEQVIDYKTREETLEGEVGFTNRTNNTLGTVIGNGVLNVKGKGQGLGVGYAATNGGKLFFHAGTVVNVENGGIGFLTNVAKGNTIGSNTSTGYNAIEHGIELSAGVINVKGGTGFVAQQGGSIQIGNNGGTAEVGTNWVKVTVEEGTGVTATGTSDKKAIIAFEKDSGLYVKNGIGISASNSDIVFNKAVLKVENGDGVILSGNSTFTNNSEKIVIDGEDGIGFIVKDSTDKTTLNNSTGIITVNNGTGILIGKGEKLQYAGSGTSGNLVVKNGVGVLAEGGSFSTNGATFTINGGTGFKGTDDAVFTLGNDIANNGPYNTKITVTGGTGVSLEDNSTAVLAEDVRLTVTDGTGIEINRTTGDYPKLTLKKGSTVTVDGEKAFGIRFIGDNYGDTKQNNIINNGTVKVTNGVGVLASGTGNTGDYYDYSGNEKLGKVVVSGKKSIGFKAENGGYIRFNGTGDKSTGVSVSNEGIGFLVNGQSASKTNEIYLRGGNIDVNNATGFKAENGGKLSIGNGSGNDLFINVANKGIGVALTDNSTAVLARDVNLTINEGIGVKLNDSSVFNNNAQSFTVNGADSVGITGTGTVDGIGTVTASNQGRGIFAGAGDNITYNSKTTEVADNGIGAEINGGTLKFGKDATVLVNGENAVGINFTGTSGTLHNDGTIDVQKGIGILVSGDGKEGVYNSTKNTSDLPRAIKVSGENSIGIKVTDKGYIKYDPWQNKVSVSNNGVGFQIEKDGKIELAAGDIEVNNGIGLKTDGTGELVIGNGRGNGNVRDEAIVKVTNGAGISLADKSTATLNSDSYLNVESGIGINVSGAEENNNVTVNGTGKITVEENAKGLYAAEKGNVLNYQSGTVNLTTENGVGVFADKGATIHFGNDMIGNVSANGTKFDTFLDVQKGTGIKVGNSSTVTVGKDVEFKLATGTTGVEIDGGIFENKTTINVGKDQIGIKFVGEDGKATNTGKIVIESGGTGFIGDDNDEVINNGTIVVEDTENPEPNSTITTGVGITSNGTIQIGDISDDDLKDKTEEEIKEEILDRLVGITGGITEEDINIKGLITDENGDVIYVAGTNIGKEIPVGPDGKVTVGQLVDEVLKTDEEHTTDPTSTGTVTITGEEGKDTLEDKVINVGGNLTIDGGDEGLTLEDTQINMYDEEKPGIPGEELKFTGKVTVDNEESKKVVDVGNDKLVIGTGTGKTDVTFIGGQITGEEGKNGGIVITGDDDTLTLDKVDVEINIGPDPNEEGIGKLVIGTGVGTEDINVGTVIVTGKDNHTGEVKTDDLIVTGGGEFTSTGIETGTVTFEDGKIDVSGENGRIDTDEIIVEDNKYGEIIGGNINVGTGGIKVGVNAELTLDGNTTVGKKDDGDMNIFVDEGGKFTNEGNFTGEGNLDIDSGSYNFETKTDTSVDPKIVEKVEIGGDIFVDNGNLGFKGDGIIKVTGGDDSIGDIKVGMDPDGNTANVTFAPESKFANGSNIKFETGENGKINIALGDSDTENSILGNPGANTKLDFNNTSYGSVKLDTDRLTQNKEIKLNIDQIGDKPYIEGLDQDDFGQLKDQKDFIYTVRIDEEKGIIYLEYNTKLFEQYGGKIQNITNAFQVINDKVEAEIDRILGEGASQEERNKVRVQLANSIYTGNIYSETVKMSYDNLKMSEDAILSLKHRTAKGELAGEGKALHSKTEYTRNGILGNTSSDSEITGLLGAVEYGLTDNTRVGGVFSGSIQDLDAENGTADGKAFYIGGYVNKHTSSYELTAGAGYQLNKFETDNTYLGNTGTEKYDSHALSAYVHGRRFVDLGDGLSFQPKAKLSYSYIEQDDVRDNLMSTEDAEIGIFEAEAGFDVVKSIYTDKAKVDVVFGTSYARAMGDTDKEFTGSFHAEDGRTSSSFDVMGAEIGENRIKFNLGAEVSYESGLFYNGGFNYSFGSGDTESYGVNIGVGYKF